MISIDTRTPQSIRDMWRYLLRSNKKLTDFGASSVTANLGQKVVKVKLLFSAFLVEHEFLLTSAHHAAKIFRNIFPDFKLMNKYRYGCTKATHMLAGAVSKQITSGLKEELLLTPWYGLATDGSSDKKMINFCPFHSVYMLIKIQSGLIAISLLDMRAMK